MSRQHCEQKEESPREQLEEDVRVNEQRVLDGTPKICTLLPSDAVVVGSNRMKLKLLLIIQIKICHVSLCECLISIKIIAHT